MTAFWGLPGYTFKGIYKEIHKHLGASVQNYIIAARTTQGFQDWNASTKEERHDVISRWQAVQVELSEQKAKHHAFQLPSCDDRKEPAKGMKQKAHLKPKDALLSSTTGEQALRNQSAASLTSNHTADEFEEAIKASVAATSRGNLEEDQMIERAIRASVMELQSASRQQDSNDEATLQRAIKASIAEAQRGRAAEHDGSAEHDRDLELSLQTSLAQPQSREDFDDSGIDTDDDEHIHAAIEKSKTGLSTDGSKDEELERAIELSKKAHEDHTNELSKTQTEEDIVMEYMKKQSSLEQELQDKLATARLSK